MRRERLVEDDLRQPAERLVLEAHPPLFLDDLALGLELLFAHVERGHAIGLEPEHERQVLRGHRLPVDRRVFVGERVGLAADARDPRRMLIGPDVARALEHQVLEQMREAGAARLLVLRPDVVPERRRARSASSDLRERRPAGRSAAWSSCSRTWSGADDGVGRPSAPDSSDDDAGEQHAQHGAISLRIIAAIMSRSRIRGVPSSAASRASRSATASLQLRQAPDEHDRLAPFGDVAGRNAGHVLAGGRCPWSPRTSRRRSRPRPSRTWPVAPDCPAIITSSSSTVLPAMPTCAASSTLRPIFTPCATCTRLSIFVPAPMRVSPTAGRSTVELRADLDVVFDHDAADLRNLPVRAVARGARSRSRRCR